MATAKKTPAPAKKVVKAEASGNERDKIPSLESLRRDVFTDAGFAEMVDAIKGGASKLIVWHRRHVLAAWRQRFAYAYAVSEASPRRLVELPRVIVGTIHSVKGGQADSVFVLPELSVPSCEAWAAGDVLARDEIRRMMYVAMTRARTALTVCGGKRGRCVQLPDA